MKKKLGKFISKWTLTYTQIERIFCKIIIILFIKIFIKYMSKYNLSLEKKMIIGCMSIYGIYSQFRYATGVIRVTFIMFFKMICM